jgi:hypothetical protein
MEFGVFGFEVDFFGTVSGEAAPHEELSRKIRRRLETMFSWKFQPREFQGVSVIGWQSKGAWVSEIDIPLRWATFKSLRGLEMPGRLASAVFP